MTSRDKYEGTGEHEWPRRENAAMYVKRKQQERQERRRTLLAAVVGWTVLVVGVICIYAGNYLVMAVRYA